MIGLMTEIVSNNRLIMLAVVGVLQSAIALPIASQELPDPPEVIIETEPVTSEENEPVETEAEPTFTPWRRVRLLHTLPKHQGSIDSLLFSPDSSIVISGGGSNDAQMRFWSVETGKHLSRIRAQNTAVLAMAIDPEGKILISGGEDAGIHLWDWQSGKYRAALLQHRSSINSLQIAPDGKTMVSGAADGIKVWDLTTLPYTPLYTLAQLGDSTNEVAVSPNGYLVASGDGNGTVKFWNLRTGSFVSEFQPHKGRISGLAFIRSGKVLVTASYDRTVKLWDLESGQLLQEFTGHSAEIRAMALHPSQTVLATGGRDGIFLWNLETGEKVTQLQDHSGWIQSLAFSPNGRYLASGGFDLMVRIWEDALFAEPEPSEVSEPVE